MIGCARIQTNLGSPLQHHEFAPDTAPIHYSDILDIHGPPSKISALPNGSVFLYEHVQITERQWGLIFPGNIGKFFKAVYAKSYARTDIITVTFNEKGFMTGYTSDAFDTDPGGGMALTIIFKLKSLSNTELYSRSQQGILDWGMSLTQPLPKGLNVAQSLDSGSRGLGVMANDHSIGQRALEIN
jgi:hypothetical protein